MKSSSGTMVAARNIRSNLTKTCPFAAL